MLPSGDVWDAGSAASSAAEFGAILAAIVLVVSAQLAQREPIQRPLSRRLAPIALIMLLLSAYEFVLLSGEFTLRELIAARQSTLSLSLDADPSLRQLLDVQSGNLQIIEQQVRTTAPLFSLAGSLLAMGAVMVVATIVVAIEEGRGSRDPVTRLSFYVAIATAVLLMLFGFQDAVSSLDESITTGRVWWSTHILAVALPTVVVRRLLPSQLDIGRELSEIRPSTAYGTFSLMSPRHTLVVAGIALCYTFVSALAYHLVSNGAIRNDLATWTNRLTVVSSVWFGLGVAVIANGIERFNPRDYPQLSRR